MYTQAKAAAAAKAVAEGNSQQQQPPQEQQQPHENLLKSVLSRVLDNEEKVTLALQWFFRRKEVHRRDRSLAFDRYEAMGIDYMEQEAEDCTREASEYLAALPDKPVQRRLLAELCQWLRHETVGLANHHSYPPELEAACEHARQPTLLQLAQIVNYLVETGEVDAAAE